MKRSQIIIFAILLFLSSGIYVVLKGNQKTQSKTMKEENKTVHIPIKEVTNAPHHITLISYGQITPNIELNVAFEVQGKLEKGAIAVKPGTNFRKGQVLYRINNTEVSFSFEAKKASMSNK